MPTNIIVHTHSGYKADEYPVWFEAGGVRHEVITVEDRWYDPSYEAFRVFADDGRTYILRHWIKEERWDLVEVR
jgi:hypothetical protein